MNDLYSILEMEKIPLQWRFQMKGSFNIKLLLSTVMVGSMAQAMDFGSMAAYTFLRDTAKSSLAAQVAQAAVQALKTNTVQQVIQPATQATVAAVEAIATIPASDAVDAFVKATQAVQGMRANQAARIAQESGFDALLNPATGKALQEGVKYAGEQLGNAAAFIAQEVGPIHPELKELAQNALQVPSQVAKLATAENMNAAAAYVKDTATGTLQKAREYAGTMYSGVQSVATRQNINAAGTYIKDTATGALQRAGEYAGTMYSGAQSVATRENLNNALVYARNTAGTAGTYIAQIPGVISENIPTNLKEIGADLAYGAQQVATGAKHAVSLVTAENARALAGQAKDVAVQAGSYVVDGVTGFYTDLRNEKWNPALVELAQYAKDKAVAGYQYAGQLVENARPTVVAMYQLAANNPKTTAAMLGGAAVAGTAMYFRKPIYQAIARRFTSDESKTAQLLETVNVNNQNNRAAQEMVPLVARANPIIVNPEQVTYEQFAQELAPGKQVRANPAGIPINQILNQALAIESLLSDEQFKQQTLPAFYMIQVPIDAPNYAQLIELQQEWLNLFNAVKCGYDVTHEIATNTAEFAQIKADLITKIRAALA